MSKHLSILPLMAAVGIFLSACKSTGRTLPSATGSIYECVVVADKTVYDTIASVMAADMPCLPQMEPYFTLSHVPSALFDDFLRSARNIVIADINPNRYTVAKAVYRRDYWSKPQAVCRLQAPDTATLVAYWQQYGEQVREWFVREELARQTRFLRANTNKEARTRLQQHFGCDMLIPQDYMLLMDTIVQTTNTRNKKVSARLLWCCNSKGPVRRDVVVYSYPYTDTLTLDNLCFMRDNVLSQVVTGSVEGSFMGTEYKHFPPQMRFIQPIEGNRGNSSSFYAAEVRGLWRLYGGEAMGGSFVSHSLIVGAENSGEEKVVVSAEKESTVTCAEKETQIVTAEVFVYAAGQKKRNPLRQAEAILYSMEEN